MGPRPEQLTNATALHALAEALVATVVAWHFDGVNVDFEWPIAAGDTAAQNGLIAFLNNVRHHLDKAAAAHSASLRYVLSYAVAWNPAGVDGRWYDYAAVVNACDYVVVMDYDTRSQVFGERVCTAGPNAPASTLWEGIALYVAVLAARWGWSDAEAASRLVLGVPWYGYVYPCTPVYPSDAPAAFVPACPIASVPFRGCNCSDAAGTQHNFSTIRAWLHGAAPPPEGYRVAAGPTEDVNASGNGLYTWVGLARHYDDAALGASTNTTAVHQVHTAATNVAQPPTAWRHASVYYDSPAVLAAKYAAAARLRLRGVSMWNLDGLDYGDAPAARADTAAMYGALRAYLNRSNYR